MPKKIIGNQDGKGGQNDSYTIPGRGVVSRSQLVREVEQGEHPNYYIHVINGEKFVQSSKQTIPSKESKSRQKRRGMRGTTYKEIDSQEIIKKVNSVLEQDKNLRQEPQKPSKELQKTDPWWLKVAGSFENDPTFDDAVRFGREWRESAE